MAYEHPISTTAEAPSTGNDMLSGTSATELTAAVHALTQAAQALTTTATQMMQKCKPSRVLPLWGKPGRVPAP